MQNFGINAFAFKTRAYEAPSSLEKDPRFRDIGLSGEHLRMFSAAFKSRFLNEDWAQTFELQRLNPRTLRNWPCSFTVATGCKLVSHLEHTLVVLNSSTIIVGSLAAQALDMEQVGTASSCFPLGLTFQLRIESVVCLDHPLIWKTYQLPFFLDRILWSTHELSFSQFLHSIIGDIPICTFVERIR